MFENLNKGTNWDYETEGFEYIKLREYLEKQSEPMEKVIIPVHGYYINQMEDGSEACTIIADECFINMPAHAVTKFKSMSEEQNEAINEGKLTLGNFKEHTNKKFKNKTIIYDFIG